MSQPHPASRTCARNVLCRIPTYCTEWRAAGLAYGTGGWSTRWATSVHSTTRVAAPSCSQGQSSATDSTPSSTSGICSSSMTSCRSQRCGPLRLPLPHVNPLSPLAPLTAAFRPRRGPALVAAGGEGVRQAEQVRLARSLRTHRPYVSAILVLHVAEFTRTTRCTIRTSRRGMSESARTPTTRSIAAGLWKPPARDLGYLVKNGVSECVMVMGGKQ